MLAINNKSPNCIPNPAECIQWNSGNIPYLGICNGDYLPKIIWEIVNKLQSIAGEDLSSFDIDSLTEICGLKAPNEVTLLNILNLLKDNQVCLKSFITSLEETVLELAKEKKINVSLSCLADVDNFGNSLSVTNDQFYQLVVNKLCNHESRITTLEGKVVELQEELQQGLDITMVEPVVATCVNPVSSPISSQIVDVADKVCDIDTKLGTSTIATALAKTPSTWTDIEYTGITGWIQVSDPRYGTLAGSYNNLLLAYNKIRAEVEEILSTCCAPTCDKIMIGFSIIPAVDAGDYTVRFRPSDGTNLFGFVDSGNSTIKFTGFSAIDGSALETGNITVNINTTDWDDNVYNLSQFDLSKPITVIIKASLVKDGLVCEKCISQIISLDLGCPVCQVLASGTKGDVGTITITYEY